LAQHAVEEEVCGLDSLVGGIGSCQAASLNDSPRAGVAQAMRAFLAKSTPTITPAPG